MKFINTGYLVHLDHGLKGDGTANLNISFSDYKKNKFFPSINLHITAGKMGYERTKKLLKKNSNRVVLGAYPKADILKKLDTEENRKEVIKELKLNKSKKIIIYAPAGNNSYEKPGGSLSYTTLYYIIKAYFLYDVNIIIKLKNKRHNLFLLPLKYIYSKLKNL